MKQMPLTISVMFSYCFNGQNFFKVLLATTQEWVYGNDPLNAEHLLCTRHSRAPSGKVKSDSMKW